MKKELLLCHMDIINMHGYCQARVTHTVPHSSIFFSSILFHHIVLVDFFLAILPHFAILPSFVMSPSFAMLQPFATLQPFAMLQPSGTKIYMSILSVCTLCIVSVIAPVHALLFHLSIHQMTNTRKFQMNSPVLIMGRKPI